MIAACKILLLLLLLFAHNAAAVGGCSQCSGTLSVTFDDYATQEMANQVAASHLAACATGKQYVVTGFRTLGNCSVSQRCVVWIYDVVVGRYCASVTKVDKVRSEPKNKYTCTTGRKCSASSRLVMNCSPNIACIGTCLPQNCV